MSEDAPLSREAFVERLRAEGARRYHDGHSFHQRMHRGELSQREIQGWVINRYYYQTRIPIKDALLLSKSEDPGFRRLWIHRITDHDGAREGEGGLALWLRLAAGVGLDPAEVAGLGRVEPPVRFACDAYVTLVRERSLLEGVASSLTEFFAPDLMSRRVAAWEAHYPWVDQGTLDYFKSRVTRARTDSHEAIDFVTAHAVTRAQQEACVAALVRKCEILWALLDAVEKAYPPAEKSARGACRG
ncbi:pyrroloquinoline-quinone synthase PqqC [Chondromyces apiculatus]|uniref:Pyrroloquinoline-quinone synthase n=1 Tax=Chondromyces apiculatus DSM 436 TaxID=1192034 RepID=A0A017T8Y4_9BACT|nr:pyrroloquinoline-quinone synthase PqqC [Chondromyces apiculatus]EYF05699.1 Coenzyme PQQ synthesis protein C [Chondromyces apiculatus DSM 436]